MFDEPSVEFVGNATTIIRGYGFTLLTDPNFLYRGEHARLGYGLRSERLTDPSCSIQDLPPIDACILSHLHDDHFDQRVIDQLDRETTIVTTTAAARRLKELGFVGGIGIRTWESWRQERDGRTVTVTAMPGRHGPPIVAALLPDVMGSLIEFSSAATPTFRLYITGDTLVHDDLRRIPERYPSIDAALLHLGGTKVLGVLVTMDGKQGVEMVRLIQPNVAMPIHYDDYTAFKSPLSDFKEAAEGAGLAGSVRYLERGVRLPLSSSAVDASASSSAG